MKYINDGKNKKKAVLLSLEEFDNIEKEIGYYKKTIEELQDELDSIEADKIMKESKGTVKFQLSDYVSNRNRAISTKDAKKTSRFRTRKNSKIYS